jgi:hypothetical protein
VPRTSILRAVVLTFSEACPSFGVYPDPVGEAGAFFFISYCFFHLVLPKTGATAGAESFLSSYSLLTTHYSLSRSPADLSNQLTPA